MKYEIYWNGALIGTVQADSQEQAIEEGAREFNYNTMLMTAVPQLPTAITCIGLQQNNHDISVSKSAYYGLAKVEDQFAEIFGA